MYGSLCTEFYDIDKEFAGSAEIKFYQSIFNKEDLILEPMCGSGRLLIPLMQAGFLVHGIDNSHAMLASCKDRAEKLGLHPILFEESIETITLSDQYDGIVIPFGSFQLFYPREKAYQVLVKFKSLLKPNGKLIMDLFVPWDAMYENNQEEHSHREVANDVYKIKIESHNIANKYEQFIASENVYTKIIDGNVVAEEKETMHIAWYYHYEMELLLEKFGFKNIQYQERFLNNETLMTFIAS